MTKQTWAVVFTGAGLILASLWLNGERSLFALMGFAGLFMLSIGAPFTVWAEHQKAARKMKQVLENEGEEEAYEEEDGFDFPDKNSDSGSDSGEDDMDWLDALEGDADADETEASDNSEPSGSLPKPAGEFGFAGSYEISKYVDGLDERSDGASGNTDTMKAAKWFLRSLIHYLWKNMPESEQNLGVAFSMIKADIERLEMFGPDAVTPLDCLIGGHNEVPPDADSSMYYTFYLNNVQYGDTDRLSVLRYCRARLLPYVYGYAYEQKSEFPFSYEWTLKSPNFYRSAICRAMERLIDIQRAIGDLPERGQRVEMKSVPAKKVGG